MASAAPNRISILVITQKHSMAWKYTGTPEGPGYTTWHHNPNGGHNWIFGPVSVGTVVNHFSTFLVDQNHSIFHSHFDLQVTGDFSPWHKMGGTTVAPPGVANMNGTAHVFYINQEGILYHKAVNQNTYVPAGLDWLKLGDGHLDPKISPTAVSIGPHQMVVFAVGKEDGALYRFAQKQGEGSSTEPEKMPGKWTASLKAVNLAGHWHIFGVGDGPINHISSERPTEVENMRLTAHGIEAIASAPGQIDLLAVTEDGHLHYRHFDNGVWNEWEDLGGHLVYPPKAVSHTSGSLAVFGMGPGGNLVSIIRNRKTGKFGGWVSQGHGFVGNV